MSATDELRRMLGERGVEWYETVNHVNCVFTWWDSPMFGEVHAMDNEDDGTLFMACLNNCDFTPQQAIAATLGHSLNNPSMSETLSERETCRNVDAEPGWFECSECKCICSVDWYGSGFGTPNFCPTCGREVEK